MVESRRVKILSKKPHGSFLLANIQRHSYNDVLLHCFSSTASSSSSRGAPQGRPVFIPSHRLILSTISPFLESLLSQAEGPEPDHPLVISLPDTDPQVLSFLLDFAYCGRTTVPLKHLDGISETSKRLRIKYLENAIVKVERAPENTPLAILKPIKSSSSPSNNNSSKRQEPSSFKKGNNAGNYQPKGGILPAQDVVTASSSPVFQPRKRTTKIRKVLIPKSSKGGSSTSDLPVVDLEECKSEVMIKNDGTHITVLRHPPSGLVLQPVSTIPQSTTPKNNAHQTSSNSSLPSPSSGETVTTGTEILPTSILSTGTPLMGGALTAVSKGFTITSPTVGVGYQGSRVLVQKSRSITLNHEGEEIIHCEKEPNAEELDEESMVKEDDNVLPEEEDVLMDEFNDSDEAGQVMEEEELQQQLEEEDHVFQEDEEEPEEILPDDEDVDELDNLEEDEDGDDDDDDDSSKTHCRTSGRVRKMNPKYFHKDNIISAAAEGITPPKERKRSRTISENNSSVPAFKKKK